MSVLFVLVPIVMLVLAFPLLGYIMFQYLQRKLDGQFALGAGITCAIVIAMTAFYILPDGIRSYQRHQGNIERKG